MQSCKQSKDLKRHLYLSTFSTETTNRIDALVATVGLTGVRIVVEAITFEAGANVGGATHAVKTAIRTQRFTGVDIVVDVSVAWMTLALVGSDAVGVDALPVTDWFALTPSIDGFVNWPVDVWTSVTF